MGATPMTRFSYPKQPGDTPWSVVDVAGPASYVQFAAANPTPTGGQLILASAFGLQELDWVSADAMSQNGQYVVRVTPVVLMPGSPFQAMRLVWRVEDSNIQPAAGFNLSTLMVRLMGIGR